MDARPCSVRSTDAARALQVLAWRELTALGEPGQAEARGDAILLPSEAGIDTYLFWDGDARRLRELP